MTKLLGLDYGSKNIGLAISDETQKVAVPLQTLSAVDFLSHLAEIVEAQEIEKIIIGLPLTMSGEIGPKAKEVQDFACQLEEALNINVEFEDERLSSKVSAGFSKQKGSGFDDHQLAAQEILQTYLDKQDARK